ncbi:MAG: hypothetical protein ABIQ38_06080 [Ilumatobacteraceae bacterium]
MTKQCERPGCSVIAEVLYGFDPGRQLVWLEHDAIPEGSRSNALCRRHADALAVPRGWSIDDRRESSPRLFSTPKSKSNVVKFAAPRSAKHKSHGARGLKLFDGDPELDLEETKAIPWTAHFDHDDDLDGLLQARGRLLSRAFGLSDATRDATRPVNSNTEPEPPATAHH